MIRNYGAKLPAEFAHVAIGGICPHCKTGTRWSVSAAPVLGKVVVEKLKRFVVGYACDSCLGPIPIGWTVSGYAPSGPIVYDPEMFLRVHPPYQFDFIPPGVAKEIKEALDCLSIGAHNGFGGCCRRAVQALCTDLGAEASTKVKNQIQEMAKATGLEQEWVDLVVEVMLAGHDGSHPHLPALDTERSNIILSLLQDLTYELYTRPGKVKQAAALRKAAIEKKAS